MDRVNPSQADALHAGYVFALTPMSQWRSMTPNFFVGTFLMVLSTNPSAATADEQAVAHLDTEYQSAVKANDAITMSRIQHAHMTLVLGSGQSSSGAELLQEARDKRVTYERQEEDPGTQTVRVFGNTAVVTARLWVKGIDRERGTVFDRRLWFSDTYVRTEEGWQYYFGQASLPLRD